MAGIGHLLAGTEMEKEARGGSAAVAAGLGLAGLGAGVAGMGYGGHLWGQSKARQDHAAGTHGVNKPGVGTFLLGGPAGVGFGRRAYDRELAALQAEKQAAARAEGAREAIGRRWGDLGWKGKAGVIGGGAAVAGGGGYLTHRQLKKRRQAKAELEAAQGEKQAGLGWRAALLGAASLGGAGYAGHHYGQRQAERDYYVGNVPGTNKPSVGTFLTGAMAAKGGAPLVGAASGTAATVTGRRGYNRRMAELQAEQGEKQAGAALAAGLGAAALGLGGAAAAGSGYFGHRYGQGMAELDYHRGTPGQYKPGLGTFALSGAAGGIAAPITAPSGVIFARRGYNKRMAQLQAAAAQE